MSQKIVLKTFLLKNSEGLDPNSISSNLGIQGTRVYIHTGNRGIICSAIACSSSKFS